MSESRVCNSAAKLEDELAEAEEDIQTLKSQLDNDEEYIQVIVARAEEAEKRAKEYKEKAEKWDKYGHLCQQSMSEEDARVLIDSILGELEVEGKCVCTEIFRSEPCNDCNDNGHIIRPATAKDVNVWLHDFLEKYNVVLKSGEILRRKNS